jgi:2-methylcitrate dehydratase PrpD
MIATLPRSVDYLHELRYGDLSEEVRARAIDVLLDTIGCMLGGAATELGEAYVRVTDRIAGQGDSTALGINRKVDAVSAAFVNAAHADALDYEDTLLGHPSSTIIPAALAIGEMVDATGEDLIAAIVAAYDVSVRIGASITPTPARARDIAVRFAWFGLAAATVGAKLMKLTPEQTLDALGYAGASSPLPVWITKWPRPLHWLKNNLAEQARAGVLGVLAAREGLGGPRTIIDDDLGFWRMVGSDRVNRDALTDRLGEHHSIVDTHFKPYPACRWLHTIIEATERLRDQHQIKPEDVKSIHVGAPDETADWFIDPNPASQIDAEFSIPYVVAVTLHRVKPGPEWYGPKAFGDPKIRELASTVSVRETSSVDHGAGSGGSLPCDVAITLKDGRELKIAHGEPWGSPERPLSTEFLREKFMAMAIPALGDPRANEVWDTLRCHPERSRGTAAPLAFPGARTITALLR